MVSSILTGATLGDHVPRLASYTCNVAVKGSIPLSSTIIWLFKKLVLYLYGDDSLSIWCLAECLSYRSPLFYYEQQYIISPVLIEL